MSKTIFINMNVGMDFSVLYQNILFLGACPADVSSVHLLARLFYTKASETESITCFLTGERFKHLYKTNHF